jgi:uncharacterized protein (DUF952 family)
MSRLIYKICPEALWREAEIVGAFRGSPVDIADGYIHFSTADLVRETAARHFARETDLVLIGVDPGRLGPQLRWERSRGGALFPHLYAMLPVSAAVSVHPLPLAPSGAHVFPDDLA